MTEDDRKIIEYVEKAYGGPMARRVDWILRQGDIMFVRHVKSSLLREMDSKA